MVSLHHVTAISKAVRYMDAHLTADIGMSDIADAVGFSPRHFHEMFKAAMGESACEYLRRRRLAIAAEELCEGQGSIQEIATRYQYGSQEAFTRAFRKMFGVAPGEYRREGQRQSLEKPLLTPAPVESRPVFIETRERKLAGIKSCYAVDQGVHQDKITEPWLYFMPRIGEIAAPSESSRFIGLYRRCRDTGLSRPTKLCYVAGVFVDSVPSLPEEMVCVTLPAAKYVVFRYEDFPMDPEELHQHITETWPRQPGCEQAPFDRVEVYDANPAEHPCKCDIYVPFK